MKYWIRIEGNDEWPGEWFSGSELDLLEHLKKWAGRSAVVVEVFVLKGTVRVENNPAAVWTSVGR